VFGSTDYTQEMNLLRDADIAVHSAKQKGGSCYVVFNQNMHQKVLQRLVLENELRRALEQHEFTLRYQPIVGLESDRLVGFEALVRWQHPEKGSISPIEFIPIAEDTGLIVPLGQWILQAACRQMVCWQTQFPAASSLKISVNLSVKQLRETDLVAQVEEILQTTGLPGQCLALEITESMLMDDSRVVNQRLKQLSDLAVQISIDDFGTGFSSLSYLHRLAVDNLKIDRSFVSNMFESQRNLNITETIIKLSQQLGLVAIAEGIETPEQLQQLKAFGCKLGQGYVFNAPITSDEATALVHHYAHHITAFP
ncbi:MAG: EAL domain-containing protein, partial [Leptolyngbyaceae bacterium]|nr:EAL domain-containing protein [Leptolyngbyaceae bacterium]